MNLSKTVVERERNFENQGEDKRENQIYKSIFSKNTRFDNKKNYKNIIGRLFKKKKKKHEIQRKKLGIGNMERRKRFFFFP